jgi:hypothetical protein
MSSECYICGRNGQPMGRVKKLVFRDLEQNITKRENWKVNGQDSGWTEGYYVAVFESAEVTDVYQCDGCGANMIKRAKRTAIIAGIVAISLLAAGITNFVLHFTGIIASIIFLFCGAISALVMLVQMSKARKKNILSSAIEEYVSKKNDGTNLSDFFDLGVGKEKKNFKLGTELCIPVEDLDSFEMRDSIYYVFRIPFTTGDFFDYDRWKEINSVP